MFTGIIETLGTVLSLEKGDTTGKLSLSLPHLSTELDRGESIAINGCCLTVTQRDQSTVTFDLLEETLSRTTLGLLTQGQHVNVERALKADGRFGGHIVQGHVDTTGEVVEITQNEQDHQFCITLPKKFSRYAIEKGSITVNGISLTIADLNPETFSVWITPHTYRATTLQETVVGDRVNLECDVLAKYVESMLRHD